MNSFQIACLLLMSTHLTSVLYIPKVDEQIWLKLSVMYSLSVKQVNMLKMLNKKIIFSTQIFNPEISSSNR